MIYQERTDNRVSMICLNPVTTGSKYRVKRGLFLTDNDLYKELTHQNSKTILLTDATTDEGEDDVAKYNLRFRNSGMSYFSVEGRRKSCYWFQTVL